MRKPARGAALVITVWLIALASVLALNYSQAVRSDTKITTSELARAQARAAAEAGFWRAVYAIGSPQHEAPWPTDGTAVEFDFGNASVSVMAHDLMGLADLNSASDATLKGIISYALGDPQRAEEITARINDWRDRDSNTRQFGAEDEDYVATNLSVHAKDGPFNTREELQLVLGVSAADYDAIAPFVTVHSQKATINPVVAPVYVKNALSELEPLVATPRNNRNQSSSRTNTPRQRRSRRGASFEILVQANVNGVISRLAASVEINRARRNGQRVVILSWREIWPYRIPQQDIDENATVG